MENEIEIKDKLDKLAEFEAERDSIEANKRALLDEVKIPAEIEALVKTGMKQMGEVESSFAPTLKALQQEVETKLALVVVPDEIKVALAEIDNQRAAIRIYQGNIEADIAKRVQSIKAEIQAGVEAKTKDVYAALAQRKADIEVEFAGKASAVDENIKKLTEEIKTDVKNIHFTVSGQSRQAVYNKGKKSWINQRLEAYTETHPDIKECYTVGEPSVTIRKV
jgi:hypothetical protein